MFNELKNISVSNYSNYMYYVNSVNGAQYKEC